MRKKCRFTMPGEISPHEGYALGFGQSFEELRDGIGHHPVAICEEHGSGVVYCPPADCVVMLDPTDKPDDNRLCAMGAKHKCIANVNNGYCVQGTGKCIFQVRP